MSSYDSNGNGARGATAPRRAERIAAARREAGLTQRELAELVGTTVWTLDRIEAGLCLPHDYTERIEIALGQQQGWLDTAPEGAPVPQIARMAETRAPSVDMVGRNLVLGAFAVIITIRFFTESIPVLPSAGNFIDILFLPILLAAALHVPARGFPLVRRESAYGVLGLCFLVICTVSATVDASRIAYGPMLLFLYGFLGPLLFYFATYRLWPAGEALSLSRLIVALGVLQFAVIAVFDLPKFVSSRNPDDIVGTFGENAYQLVFYLLVFCALVAGIATVEPRRPSARGAPLIFGATFVVIFLAQYRALLVATAVVIVVVALMLRRESGKGVLVGGAVVLAFAAGLGYVATHFPEFKFAPTIRALQADPGSFVEGRLAPAKDIASLYADDPRFVVTGTGPGTYSSRAWRTFAEVGDPSSAEGAAQPYAAKLTGGKPYRTDVSDRYIAPRLKNAKAQAFLGSTALGSPFSSYYALLAEVGVLGFVVMTTIYLRALLASWRIANVSLKARPREDPIPALALATFVAFLLLIQMGMLDNWWEVARVTVPSWIMLAVCTKEDAARRRAGART